MVRKLIITKDMEDCVDIIFKLMLVQDEFGITEDEARSLLYTAWYGLGAKK